LQKLEFNKSVLGDWLLAIAAYNCGLNRIKTALEDSSSNDFWELAENGYLPPETMKYVPKFLAVVHIARNAEMYNVKLPGRTSWQWERIPLSGQVNLRLLAETAGIPTGILALGNAELEYDVTPPGEYPYHLKIPDIYSDVINRTLGDMPILDRFNVHNVKRGDTLYALAMAYNVPVDVIMLHNPGIEPRFLQINTKLIVPVVKDVLPFRNEPAAPRPRNSLMRHTVKEGETLWGIAEIYGTTVNRLLEANGISAERPIKPGQVLNIPVESMEMIVR
jgi:membrane-bound lytic murein transglycosylase D